MRSIAAKSKLYLIIADRCLSLAVVKIEHIVIVVVALDAAKFMFSRSFKQIWLSLKINSLEKEKKLGGFSCTLEDRVLSKWY